MEQISLDLRVALFQYTGPSRLKSIAFTISYIIIDHRREVEISSVNDVYDRSKCFTFALFARIIYLNLISSAQSQIASSRLSMLLSLFLRWFRRVWRISPRGARQLRNRRRRGARMHRAKMPEGTYRRAGTCPGHRATTQGRIRIDITANVRRWCFVCFKPTASSPCLRTR